MIYKDDNLQVLYPTHCVQNSWGAELCPELVRAENAKYVLKGSQVFVDAYSAFVDNRGEHRFDNNFSFNI